MSNEFPVPGRTDDRSNLVTSMKEQQRRKVTYDGPPRPPHAQGHNACNHDWWLSLPNAAFSRSRMNACHKPAGFPADEIGSARKVTLMKRYYLNSRQPDDKAARYRHLAQEN